MSYTILPDGTVEFNQKFDDKGDKVEPLKFTDWVKECKEALEEYFS